MSFVTFLTALALYLYGGDSLRGMAESQMIGIVIGTLSSIFISGALLTMGPLRVSKQDLMPKAKGPRRTGAPSVTASPSRRGGRTRKAAQ